MNESLYKHHDFLSILVVEDDIGLSRLIRKKLEQRHFKAEIASSGQEAIAYALKNPNIFLLLDYRLGDMTGREIVEKLKQQDRELPFIIMTGHGDERIAVEMMKLGARDYLVKDQQFIEVLPQVIENVFIQLFTEHKLLKMEEALKKSEYRFRMLFNSGTDTILVSAIENGQLGRFLEVNDIACQRLNYSREEFIRLTPNDIEDASDETLREHRQTLLKSGYVLYETSHVAKNGAKIPVETNSHRIDLDGSPAVLSISRDITERKHLEEQLRQAHKMEAIGKLAGGVAHDFNNLLTAILGYSELLLVRMGEENPYKDGIKEIKKAGERAASLTQQLLAFSRKQMLKPKILDINQVVVGIEKMLKRIIGENIALVSDLEPGVSPMKADPGQVEQIILNLAVNSSDAMQEGGQLTIKTANRAIDDYYCSLVPDSQPGHYICLSITDTGDGMDKETQMRIFEPFFTTKKIGTGLGLSVVYGIIKQHNGWITVYSEIGRGATFNIYFPAVEDSQYPQHFEQIPLTQLQGNNEKILFVEDEEGVRKVTVRALRDYGYHVSEAVSAKEAIDIFKEKKGDFAMVFSDIVLADKSGIDLVEELRTDKSDLKILLTSGYADRKSRWSDVNKKGLPFLQKPYSLEDLLKSIRETLRQDT